MLGSGMISRLLGFWNDGCLNRRLFLHNSLWHVDIDFLGDLLGSLVALPVRLRDIRVALPMRLRDIRVALLVRFRDIRVALPMRLRDIRVALPVY